MSEYKLLDVVPDVIVFDGRDELEAAHGLLAIAGVDDDFANELAGYVDAFRAVPALEHTRLTVKNDQCRPGQMRAAITASLEVVAANPEYREFAAQARGLLHIVDND